MTGVGGGSCIADVPAAELRIGQARMVPPCLSDFETEHECTMTSTTIAAELGFPDCVMVLPARAKFAPL